MPVRKTEIIERDGGVDVDLIARIVKSPLKVTIEGVDDKGDIFFISDIRQLGFTKDDLATSALLIRTRFFTDFLGELLLRYNIDEFVRYISDQIDAVQYMSMVSRTRHGGFGLFILEEDESLRFQFHVSFIQKILSEDINQIAN